MGSRVHQRAKQHSQYQCNKCTCSLVIVPTCSIPDTSGGNREARASRDQVSIASLEVFSSWRERRGEVQHLRQNRQVLREYDIESGSPLKRETREICDGCYNASSTHRLRISRRRESLCPVLDEEKTSRSHPSPLHCPRHASIH